MITQKLVGGVPIDTYQNLNYQQFDGKGNLITLADTLNGITHSHTYDSLDRLLTANGVGTNPYSQSYQYDRIGNITYKSDMGHYTYDYSNKPHAVKSVVIQNPVYNDPILSIAYNHDNKPELIKRDGSNYVQFTYDGNGQRVKKYNYTTGQTVLYFGGLYEIRSGVGMIHLFAGNKRVASVLADGRTQFYHTNHLDSAMVITDQNGDRKERMEYFPFGTYRESIDYDPNFPDVFYTFTGQEEDDDLGLYNYGERLYDPVLGRFISADPIVPDPTDTQSLNRYSYVRNNPLHYTDPTGNYYDAGGCDLSGSDSGGWDLGGWTSNDMDRSDRGSGWNPASRSSNDTAPSNQSNDNKDSPAFDSLPDENSHIQLAQVVINPEDIVFDPLRGWRPDTRDPQIIERESIQREQQREEREAIQEAVSREVLKEALATAASVRFGKAAGALVEALFEVSFPHKLGEEEQGKQRKTGGGDQW